MICSVQLYIIHQIPNSIISIRFARFVSREFRITKLFFRSQRELKLFSKEQLSLCFVLFRKNSNYLICLISGGMVLMIYFQFMYVCVKTMPTPKERKANNKLKSHYNNLQANIYHLINFQHICLRCTFVLRCLFLFLFTEGAKTLFKGKVDTVLHVLFFEEMTKILFTC